MRRKMLCAILLGGIALLFSLTSARAQESGETVVIKKAATTKLTAGSNTPTCITIGVEKGDPASGPAVMLARFSPGCSVPWHWHTPNENVMMVSGSLRVEMKGEKTTLQRAGDYAFLPSHHIHQAKCMGPAACLMFIYSDAPFDLHYVGKNEEEISLAEALKGIKTTRR